jgi:hypothetical protein
MNEWMYLASMRRTVMTRRGTLARAKGMLLAERLHPRGMVLVGHALQFGREARIDGLQEEVVQRLEPGGSLAIVQLRRASPRRTPRNTSP